MEDREDDMQGWAHQQELEHQQFVETVLNKIEGFSNGIKR